MSFLLVRLYEFFLTVPRNGLLSCFSPLFSYLFFLKFALMGADPLFRCNDLAIELMGKLGVTAKWIRLLPTLLLHDQDITEKELDEILDVHLPKLGVNLRKRVKEALAIAAYRTQSIYP